MRLRLCGAISVTPLFRHSRSSGSLALCTLLMPAAGAQAAVTWTYTPELRRLDADGNELPAGEADVERDGILRVGLYVTVSADGAAPADEAVLGFESFLGAIHFSSDEMGPADIAAIVRSLREGRGWERRMANTSYSPAGYTDLSNDPYSHAGLGMESDLGENLRLRIGYRLWRAKMHPEEGQWAINTDDYSYRRRGIELTAHWAF